MTLPTENDTQQLYNQTTDQKKSEAFGMICNVTETIIIRENSQYYIKHCVCCARKLPLALKNTYPSVLSSVSSIPHLTREPPAPPPPPPPGVVAVAGWRGRHSRFMRCQAAASCSQDSSLGDVLF